MVAVWCYQDVNGDGIQVWSDDGGDLVYIELRHPDEQFTLGGGSSDWVGNAGPAVCEGKLYAYGWKRGQESIRELATKGFDATG